MDDGAKRVVSLAYEPFVRAKATACASPARTRARSERADGRCAVAWPRWRSATCRRADASLALTGRLDANTIPAALGRGAPRRRGGAGRAAGRRRRGRRILRRRGHRAHRRSPAPAARGAGRGRQPRSRVRGAAAPVRSAACSTTTSIPSRRAGPAIEEIGRTRRQRRWRDMRTQIEFIGETVAALAERGAPSVERPLEGRVA